MPYLKANNYSFIQEEVSLINNKINYFINQTNLMNEIHDFCLRTPFLNYNNESTIYFIENINCFSNEEKQEFLWELEYRTFKGRHRTGNLQEDVYIFNFINDIKDKFLNLDFFIKKDVIKIASFYKDHSLLQLIRNLLQEV